MVLLVVAPLEVDLLEAERADAADLLETDLLVQAPVVVALRSRRIRELGRSHLFGRAISARHSKGGGC